MKSRFAEAAFSFFRSTISVHDKKITVACGTHDTCNTDCWIKAVPACGWNAQFHKPGFLQVLSCTQVYHKQSPTLFPPNIFASPLSFLQF